MALRLSAEGCLSLFRLLLVDEIGGVDRRESRQASVEDQLARFNIWAGNIGVFAEGHASLDYRVRDNDDLRDLILSFFDALKDLLGRARENLRLADNSETLPGLQTPHSGLAEDDGSETIHESDTSAVSSSFKGSDATFDVTWLPTDPYEQRLSSIERILDQLRRLSFAIRRPSAGRNASKVQSFVMRDEEGNDIERVFADYSFRLVKHRFPGASLIVQERLATGIAFRRKRFLYQQNHQKKLNTKIHFIQPPRTADADSRFTSDAKSTIVGVPIIGSPTQENLPSRLASQRDTVPSQTSASAMTKRPIELDGLWEAEAERSSTMFSAAFSEDISIRIPQPPKGPQGGKEFECPFCTMLLPIGEARTSHWRRHLMADLEPWICVFESCPTPDITYGNRHSWKAHMQDVHAKQWVCSSAGNHWEAFSTKEAYRNHMILEHKGAFSSAQLELLVQQSLSHKESLFENCPLCGFVPTRQDIEHELRIKAIETVNLKARRQISSDQIVKHVSAHLQLLATTALPWQEECLNDDAEVEADKTASGRVEEDSDASDLRQSSIEEDDSLPTLDFADDPSLNRSSTSTSLSGSETSDSQGSLIPEYYEDWKFMPKRPRYSQDRDPALQTFLRSFYLARTLSVPGHGGPQLPTHLMPLHRNKQFFGRTYALEALKEALLPKDNIASSGAKPITFPRTFTIHGPGGIGKTQVAAEFLNSQHHVFDATFWIHAEDTAKISQGFRNIAVKLQLVSGKEVDSNDLSYTRDIVKKWLLDPVRSLDKGERRNTDKAKWLLVFDGVEDPDILNDFWPYNGPGSILVTSRNPFSWGASLPLRPFTPDEAVTYLLQLTRRTATDEDKLAVAAITRRLSGLPLALTQMGHVMVHKNLSFAEFLKLYEERENQHGLLQLHTSAAGTFASRYEHSIASVWAFDDLAHGGALLNVLSMLDPDGIPEAIPSNLKRELDLPNFPKTLGEYEIAKKELLSCSLVTINNREQRLFIHRLVQEVTRARMTLTELRRTFMACVKLISSIWPFEDFGWRHGIARWAACEELFPHVLRLKDLFSSISLPADMFENYSFAQLLVDAGWYFHERGKSPGAILFNSIAQGICESLKLRLLEHPGPNKEVVTLRQLNFTLAEINHNLGCIATEINEPADALKHNKIFKEMVYRELGDCAPEDEPRVAISWNELGIAYMLNEDWKKGEECFRTSMELMRKVDSSDPTQLSLPVVNIGLSYWLQGRTTEAANILEDGLRHREAKYGRADRVSFVTGRFLHALGNVKGGQGFQDEGLNYHHRALVHYKSTLGNNHHRTADLFVKVAEHNIRLQQYEMALALLDHALKAYSNSNIYVPEKARALFKRSLALRGLGKTEEAGTELQRTYNMYSMYFVKLADGNDGDASAQIRARKAEKPNKKATALELTDQDIDHLVAFWSK